MRSPTTEPAVSFVIPALDAEATLGAALDAIQAACRGSAGGEILLIDNGSRDRTVDIARDRGAKVISAPGLTVAALRNLGARLSRADLLAFVDADCVIAPDWLEQGSRHFSDPAVGAVGSPTHVPRRATWVQRAWALHRHRRNRPECVEWLPTENLLVRKTAWHDVAGFNESLVTCEDVDFCYRLGTRHKILNDPDLRSFHLGEAPTLAAFFRKEAWRGGGNLAGFLAHDFRATELPSLLFPLYHLVAIAALLAAIGQWVATREPLPVLASIAMVTGPSLVLATSTALRARQVRAIPPLVLVYLAYALARSAALLPRFSSGRRRRLAQLRSTTVAGTDDASPNEDLAGSGHA